MLKRDITLCDIYMARGRLAPIIRRTPLFSSPSLTEYVGVPVYLKHSIKESKIGAGYS